MSDHPITLTNVMRGVRKHGLVDKLSDGCFKLLIGLILEANELGFKNPIDMTVKQALVAGGGNNRQTLNTRRKTLAKFRLDRKPLVKITAGNHAKNTLATYEINYKLLCSYNGVWQGIEAQPSRNLDIPLDIPLDKNLDGNSTILRSDQKREEQKERAKPVVPTTEERTEQLRIRELLKLPVWHKDLCHEAHKFGALIRKEHDWVNANIESVRLDLIKLLDYNIEDVLAVMRNKDAPGRNTDELDWVVAELEGGK